MVNPDVRKRLLLGAGANAYGTAVNVVVQLAGVPILLHAWGAQRYGAWLVLFAIPAYLSLANLGYSLSVANDMTARVASGDRGGAVTAYHSLIALVSCTGLGVAALVGALAWLLPLAAWLHLPGIPALKLRSVFLLLAAEVLVQLSGGVASAGYRASGEYGLGVAVNTTTIIGQYVALWSVALAGLGLVGAAAAFLAVRIVGSAVALLYLSRRHAWLQPGLRKADLRYLRKLVGPSLASAQLPLASALRNQGFVLVVNLVLGPIAVVTFSVLRTLSRVSQRLVMIIANAIEPEIAFAAGQSNLALQRRLYVGALCASLWVSAVAGITLYLVGDLALRVWTSAAVQMNHTLFLWLLASSVSAALWQVSLSTLQALNRHVRAAAAYVTSAGVALLVAFELLNSTGRLADAGMAMLLGDLLFVIYVTTTAGRTLELDMWETARHVGNPLALMRLHPGRAPHA